MRKLLAVSCWLLVLSGCVEAVPDKINTVAKENGNLKVIPPKNCPDWTKVDGNGGSNFGNTPSSNYGCATVTNYGAMIEDPHDLVEGKHSSLTNSSRSAAAVSAYEAGSSGGAAPSAPSSSASAP